MIRFIPIAFSIVLAVSFDAHAGGDFRKAGARSAAMGHSSITLSDAWSNFNNQAALADLESPVAGFYYENRFMLKELGYSAAAFALPLKAGIFGLNVSHFGFESWNESKAGLAFARSFGKRFSAGIQLDYISIRQLEFYGNRGFLTFEVGILSKISSHLTIGAHVYNPLNASLSEVNDERAPSCLRLGAAWTVNERFTITAETEKQLDKDPFLSAGMECRIADMVVLRAGISTATTLFSFGVGIRYNKFLFDFSTSSHQVLGFSPQASITYLF